MAGADQDRQAPRGDIRRSAWRDLFGILLMIVGGCLVLFGGACALFGVMMVLGEGNARAFAFSLTVGGLILLFGLALWKAASELMRGDPQAEVEHTGPARTQWEAGADTEE